MKRNGFRSAALLTTAILSIGTAAAGPAIEVNAYGNSYGAWSAQWWQWLLSIPAKTSPNLSSGEVDCSQGQSGNVWFFGGSFGTTTTVVRKCKDPIPQGRALFFPLINNIAYKPNGRDTINSLRQLAASVVDKVDVTSLSCVITPKDGSPQNCAADYSLFRAKSPSFSAIVPSGSLIPSGQQSGPSSSDALVSDGYWILLPPLPAGSYQISFGGSAATTPPFATSVAYQFEVKP